MTEERSAEDRRLVVARAMKVARKRYGTMRRFTADLRSAIGWPSLSMAAVYAWEAGTTRVPAVALVAAAELAGASLDGLLGAATAGADDPPAVLPVLEARLRRLEERVERLESQETG